MANGLNLFQLFTVNSPHISFKTKKDDYKQAEMIVGEMKILADKKIRTIKSIEARCIIEYFTEKGIKEKVELEFQEIVSSFVLYPEDERKFNFSYKLPYNIPISSNFVFVTLELKMNIEMLPPQSAKKILYIYPNEELHYFLYGLHNDLKFQANYRAGIYENNRQVFEYYAPPYLREYGLELIQLSFKFSEFFLEVSIGFKYLSEIKFTYDTLYIHRPELYNVYTNLIDPNIVNVLMYNAIINKLNGQPLR